jgi:predicted dehydrogenase
MKVRVGILGAGDWATANHLPALSLIRDERLGPSDIELTALCEADDARATRAMQKFGIERRVAVANDLFTASDIDALVIVVRATRVARFVEAAQAAGKPFFIEKPSAETAADALRLANSVSVPNVVGFNRRYFPVVEELDRVVRTLARPRIIRATFLRHARRDSQDFAANPEAGHFPFMTGTGIHMINLCEHLFGEIRSCSGARIPAQPNGVDGWAARFSFVDASELEATFLPTTGTSVERIEVHTPDVSVLARLGLYGEPDGAGSIEVHRQGRVISTWVPPTDRHLVERGFVGEHLDLFHALANGKGTRSNVGNAHTSLRWAEVLEASPA